MQRSNSFMVQVPLSTPTTTLENRVHKPERRRFSLPGSKVILYAILVILTITSLGPFIFSFFSSFKTFSHILDFPPTLIPQPWTFDNITTLLSYPGFLRWILNSFIVGFSVAALNVLFSAMAGYALSRLRFPGRGLVFTLTLAVMMI